MIEAMVRALVLNRQAFFLLGSKGEEQRRRVHEEYLTHIFGAGADDGVSLGATDKVLSREEMDQYLSSRFQFSREMEARHCKAAVEVGPGFPSSFVESAAVRGVLGDMSSIISNFKLLRTEAGYIGVGAQNAEAGDEVCIFPGSSVPLVLRAVARVERGQEVLH
jgi:hypothetical protein